MVFRLLGMQRDFLVVGSDAGRLVILEYDKKKERFVKVIQETYGKTGCRRIVPGEYLAADPKGRVLLVGAVERQKFVYQMNRDQHNKLIVSSPLEAHKPHTLTLDICALDNGLENPQFACIEIDYGEPDSKEDAVVTGKYHKMLVVYEVDLGLNHVVRKFAEPLPETAHRLVAVPGSGDESDGPSGVLVACENFLLYKKQDHEDRRCSIPVRYDQSTQSGAFITGSQSFFRAGLGVIIFLQSEHGDLFKVSLDQNGPDVFGIQVHYFDTIAPATQMNLLESGFLFVAGDCSNHVMYRLTSLGSEDEKAIVSNSTMPFDENDVAHDHKRLVRFCPSAALQNMEVCDQMQNLACINDMIVDDLLRGETQGTPQIYVTCGKANHGTLRQLTHGLTVIEMATTPMPRKPLRVLPLKENIEDEYDKFLVVSFSASSLILGVDEGKITSLSDTEFHRDAPTLHLCLLYDGSYVQVTDQSVYHIRSHLGKEYKSTAWHSDPGRKITQACSNSRQLILQIERDQLIYFEVNDFAGKGGELRDAGQKLFKQPI